MSKGKCGLRQYNNIDQNKIDVIIAELKKSGSTVRGNGPWNVDTNNHGVKLKASWVEPASILTVIVTDKEWYVPCSKVWETIDLLMDHIQSISESEIREVAEKMNLLD